MSESRWFGETMVELSPHTLTEIIITFPINYKPAFPKIKDLFKLSFKIIVFVLRTLCKKLTLVKFFQKNIPYQGSDSFVATSNADFKIPIT